MQTEEEFKEMLNKVVEAVCEVRDISPTPSNFLKLGLKLDPSNYHRWIGRKLIPAKQQDKLSSMYGISKEFMKTGKGVVREAGASYVSNPAKIEILAKLAESREQTINLMMEKHSVEGTRIKQLEGAIKLCKEKIFNGREVE